MAGQMLKMGVGLLALTALVTSCDRLPGRSDTAATSDATIVQRGKADGAAWQLHAKKGDQGCLELVQVEPQRTAARVCPQPEDGSNSSDALRYTFGSLVSSSKARSVAVVAFGIADMQVARVTVDFASGKSLDGTTRKGSPPAMHRYFAIPLESIPQGGVKSIRALDESGNTLASFELRPGGSQSPAGPSPDPTVSTTPTGATPTPTPTSGGATAESASFAGSPPWLDPPVPQSQTPRVLMVAWEKAKNRSDCSPLVPDSLGEGDGGKPRRANFSGGWAVAYDKAGLPGRLRSGEPCKDCGRGAFGIAGTGTEIASSDELDPSNALTLERRWSDGSRADYGLEGGTGPNYLATLFVQGEGCVYNVWSFIGQAHLEHLLDHLRFVEAAKS